MINCHVDERAEWRGQKSGRWMADDTLHNGTSAGCKSVHYYVCGVGRMDRSQPNRRRVVEAIYIILSRREDFFYTGELAYNDVLDESRIELR